MVVITVSIEYSTIVIIISIQYSTIVIIINNFFVFYYQCCYYDMAENMSMHVSPIEAVFLYLNQIFLRICIWLYITMLGSSQSVFFFFYNHDRVEHF